MTVINNATLILKDKQGNEGVVKSLTNNDINKISNAITDIGQVVDPATHMPIEATTASVGVVQLATAQDITNGTANKVVDAKELADAIKANKTDIASLVADKATKAELAEIAEKSNAITVSNTAPDTSNMTNASGVLHPSSDVITENPDVSILALQNDMWAYDATRDYVVGSFVIYNNSIYQCLVANGPSSTVANPSNVVYWTQIPTMEDLKNKFVPTGTILLYAGSVLPDSYLGCQGAPFDPTVYTDLYAKIGTTYGGTAQSPLLPDFRDRYPIGAGTNAVGTQIAEQLPNITGSFYDQCGTLNGDTVTGAFTTTQTAKGTATEGTKHAEYIRYFDANNSNTVYTDNGKVYPASIALNFIIKT